MASNDINKQKSPRKISPHDIKQKFENNHWNLEFIPYVGQDFIAHSQKNNKSFNFFRNVLILDIGLEDNFNSVEEQAVNENCSFCLKNFINSLNDEINITDLVYHCFLATKKILQNKDSLFKYSVDVCAKGPIVLGESELYTEYELNKKNIFGIKEDDLKLSAEILNEVILQAHPDIILIFGDNLNSLIDFAFFQTFNEGFDDFCRKANIKHHTINPNAWKKPECKNVEANKTMLFLQDEKKHRHNSDFNIWLTFIIELVKGAKEYAQGKKERYSNVNQMCSSDVIDAYDSISKEDDAIISITKSPAPHDSHLWVHTETRDNLIDSLNMILRNLSFLNNLKDSLIDPDKQRYKPQRKADERIGKGRRNRKKEE